MIPTYTVTFDIDGVENCDEPLLDTDGLQELLII